MPKTSIDTAHGEIAKTIRLAKKRMFKAHREGKPLHVATVAFNSEINDAISQQDLLLRFGDRNDLADAPTDDPQPDTDSDEETPPERAVMESLGLDWPTIDQVAHAYLTSGDDDHLVVTIGLLQRLLNLEKMRGGNWPEDLECYLPMLIARLFRSTYQVENMAHDFALAAEARLPKVLSASLTVTT